MPGGMPCQTRHDAVQDACIWDIILCGIRAMPCGTPCRAGHLAVKYTPLGAPEAQRDRVALQRNVEQQVRECSCVHACLSICVHARARARNHARMRRTSFAHARICVSLGSSTPIVSRQLNCAASARFETNCVRAYLHITVMQPAPHAHGRRLSCTQAHALAGRMYKRCRSPTNPTPQSTQY